MREKKVLKDLKKALKQDYLYDEKELSFMKEQLVILEQELLKTRNKPEGFGK